MAVKFVLLSFEGPDAYSNAGGLGSRVSDLSATLASKGYETHLFFVGDPAFPGHEQRQEGLLHLHRWGQWISQYHPNGVYDGEEGKVWDWERSLPEWLVDNLLAEFVSAGDTMVVMAEEWHTARSVVTIHSLVSERGLRDQVCLLWNANNPFGFHRVPWEELREAAVITTVSRYMRTLMMSYGVEARVLPNGIQDQWLAPVHNGTRKAIRRLLSGRTSLTKVARWDPDKRWGQSVEAVSIMKRIGMRPLLLARGGLEGYGQDVLGEARDRGLDVRHVRWEKSGDLSPMMDALQRHVDGDMIVMDSPLTLEERRALFHGSTAVLANSGREPFGLVGLETMAAGGVAMVGCSGEDYATAGRDSISLQTKNPWEIVHNVAALQDSPIKSLALRTAGHRTAAHYTWDSVIVRSLFPALEMLGVPGLHRPPEDDPRSCARPKVLRPQFLIEDRVPA